MNKTLHKKLTQKTIYFHTPTISSSATIDDVLTQIAFERKIQQQISRDLLSPRAESIQFLLQKSREL